MIVSEQERDALMALVARFGNSMSGETREDPDDLYAAIRAMLAPDDAVVIGENVINDDGEPEGYDRYKLADALYNGRGWELKDLGLALVRVLRGEATRDE